MEAWKIKWLLSKDISQLVLEIIFHFKTVKQVDWSETIIVLEVSGGSFEDKLSHIFGVINHLRFQKDMQWSVTLLILNIWILSETKEPECRVVGSIVAGVV